MKSIGAINDTPGSGNYGHDQNDGHPANALAGGGDNGGAPQTQPASHARPMSEVPGPVSEAEGYTKREQTVDERAYQAENDNSSADDVARNEAQKAHAKATAPGTLGNESDALDPDLNPAKK